MLLLWILLYSGPSWSDNGVISLHYADGQQVIEALDGLLEPGGSIRAYQNQIVIQASAANIEELRGLIEILDEPPRSLRISVRSSSQTATRNEVFKVSDTNTGLHNHRIRNPDGTITQSRVRLSSRSRSGHSLGSSAVNQSIQALEGRDAFIQVAESSFDGNTTATRQGFWVNARVQGQQVVLSVHTHSDRANHDQITRSGLASQVIGQLGSWLAVGSLSGQQRQSQQTIPRLAWNNRSSASVVYIKVEWAD